MAKVVLAFFALSAAVYPQSSDCNAPLASPQKTIELPSHPFKLAVTSDGCHVFAAQMNPGKLSVIDRRDGKLEVARSVPVNGNISGLAITHDGKTLIGTNGSGVVLMDVARLVSGTGDPIVGSINEGDQTGSIYVNITSDDKTVFVADEGAATITVIDLPSRKILGKIPTGGAPIALTFSKDGRWLYTTAQGARPDWGWPAVCDPEMAPPGRTLPKHPEGAVVVVDVAKARTDPEHAVAQRVKSGCNAVRLALAPAGDRVYVTTRKDNAIRVFEAAKLTSDPEHALVGTVEVGTAPVPVIVIDGGKRVIVGNSNRFGTGGGQTLTVVDTEKMAAVGSIACGQFPRDLVLSPDGKTLFLANFGSSSLQAMDVQRLPVER
jgi:YVTN family beta-propeller protein